MRPEAMTRRGRRRAESLMTDTCTIDRPTGQDVTDPDTGVVSPELTPVLDPISSLPEHRCKVQSSVAQAATPEAGGHAFTVEQLQVHLPVSSACRVNDEVLVTASTVDPDLVGLRFRLVELARGTYRTADRWNVELVTA